MSLFVTLRNPAEWPSRGYGVTVRHGMGVAIVIIFVN